ncbi:PREDICTED: bZIP transcription factor TRAB1-like [Populus euphratica]|uniref:BZIP transcription factor TRAB1-like n=1 Tax=Populus euphratica TaxID=75702 RepID=A0AAJ6TU79_POPEU|nr:PREDICTED: bZIP transcription factor TRAB1-like [Populus euphratica]
MGTNFNFKNFSNDPSDAVGGRPPGNSPLTRQSSIYSLTFDELQNTMGGSLGKDFGSMNMDELLKNIWSAEETQTIATATSTGVQEGGALQRQGSLTLPRTLSQRTVDEVWKDMSKEYVINGTSAGAANNVPQRQPTLGGMTLEEFLLRAGVAIEDIQVAPKVNTNGGLLGDLSRSANNSLAIGFQQNRGVGLDNDNTNQISLQSSNLPLNVNGVRSNQAQVQQQQQQIFPKQPNMGYVTQPNNDSTNQISLQSSNLPLNVNGVRSNQAQVQQQQIFPKQPNLGYVTQMPLQSGPGIRGGMLGIGDQGMDSGLMQGGGMGVVGLGGIATGSPANQLSSDGIGKSNGDTSSVSPVPYVFRESVRGRRAGGAVEKVVERRQRRMIKNRESAARSRARKQAYTMELEAEVAKLKEENEELRKKQAEMMEIQKNQVAEMMNMQQGGKKRCLRRTQTGPW